MQAVDRVGKAHPTKPIRSVSRRMGTRAHADHAGRAQHTQQRHVRIRRSFRDLLRLAQEHLLQVVEEALAKFRRADQLEVAGQ